MSQKDYNEKILLNINEIFADVVNVLMFNGKQVVNPKSLTDASTIAQYKSSDGNGTRLDERDVAKIWKKGKTCIMFFGIENQTDPDKNMPIRIMEYDAAAYRTQNINKVKPYPVASIVLYFGDKHWNKNKSLKSILNVPKEFEDYVNDYKIHVFEIAWLTDEQINMFRSDFGIVADFFVQKRKNKDYIPNNPKTIKYVEAVMNLLAVFTGEQNYSRIQFSPKEIKGGVNMCTVADNLMRIGFNKGIEQGIAQDRKMIIEAISKMKSGVSYEEIAAEFGEEIAQIANML